MSMIDTNIPVSIDSPYLYLVWQVDHNGANYPTLIAICRTKKQAMDKAMAHSKIAVEDTIFWDQVGNNHLLWHRGQLMYEVQQIDSPSQYLSRSPG